jgi:hypothetical protein
MTYTKLERRPNVVMLYRAIYTSAVCSARARTTPFIKKFPVTLRLQYPSWDTPGLAEFSSAEDITAFLSKPKQFLIEPITGQIIRPHQVDKIDPDVIYDVADSGFPYREKGLSREQASVGSDLSEEVGTCFEGDFGKRRSEGYEIAESDQGRSGKIC